MTSTMHRRLADTPIAIVGLGALFPRSGDLHKFWGNIVEARDCIEEVPETHWSVDDYYDPDPSTPDKTYCKRGGFLPTVPFKPLEFGLPPNTLEVTDVLQLLSLVVGKQTLADAGAPEAEWYDPSRTGVILGVTGANSLTQPLATRLQTPVLKEVVRSCGLTENDAEVIADKFTSAFAPWEENSFPGMLGNVVAGRMANRFDFGGKNCTVDAACASSLAAVDMAVGELVSGRADLMITGGCDAENTILMYMCFSKTPAFSRSGTIRPFDEHGDGTLIGEGMGMLALKRLADAERDGDRVYSVLRGIGSSSDGRFKSIYAPRKEGQVLALRRAYQDAGFGPDQVGLVECHGTGTAVGDLTELTALKEVYAAESDDTQFAAVGSVKSQIGHTKAAAGAASLIKASLALHQRVLPPTLNVEHPRGDAEFPDSPFYVNTETRPWIRDPNRSVRRAAVSSFGFGGTNFHCVLEEHPRTDGTLHAGSKVHVWHAGDPDALLALLHSEPRGVDPDEPIPHEHARLALVAVDELERDRLREHALERLAADLRAEQFDLPGGAYYRRRVQDEARVAALFAGQGSQYTGMGARAAIAVPAVREAFDAAADEQALGRVVFPPPAFDQHTGDSQETRLRRTEHAQPAIGALSVGQYRYLAERGFHPGAALGHSFGELTALWVAGSLDDADFHRLARARGQAMAVGADAGDPGTMAAVSAAPDRVTTLLAGHDDVAVCNLNAPDQTVVGGGTRAVADFVAACHDAGVQARELPVSGAFHTRYVSHATEPFAAAASQIDVHEPRLPVYANTEGAAYGPDLEANRKVLVDQLTNPLSFAPRVRELYDDGFRVFVEFGPKSVLSGLVRRTLADCPDTVVLAADAGPGRDSDRSLKQLAARLTVLGLPLTQLNRHLVENTSTESTEGLTIPLNGVNYVSEERRQAYRTALESGYQADQPSNGVSPTSNGVGVSTSADNGHSGSAVASASTAAVQAEAAGAGMLAAEHLAAHREYLNGQLRVAQQLSDMLQRESEHGPRDGIISGISALTQQSVAIGHSHAHASDVLSGFAAMETGGPQSAPAAPVEAYRPAVAPHQSALGAAPAQERIAFDAPPAPAPTTATPEPSAPTGPALAAGSAAPPAPPAASPAPASPPPQQAGPDVSERPSTATAPAESAAVGTSVPVGSEGVRETLMGIVASKTGYPADMLDPGMDIEADLGIDSIKRVEIMGALREEFPAMPEPGPEELGELRTLEHIVGLIARVADGTAAHPKV